jgi:phosphatidylglycerol---prolipoprotein diacylglyceryl transferase
MSRRTGKTTARPRPMYPALKMPPRVAPAPAADAAEPDDRLTTLVQRASQHILAVTYWFEPAPQPQPYPVTIRFTGRRVDVEGKLERRDQFVQDETIAQVVPGSGPISVTARVRDIHPGAWEVNAAEVAPPHRGRAARPRESVLPIGAPRGLLTRIWRRWATVADGHQPVKTSLEPWARVPGALGSIWGGWVTLGMIVAVVAQVLLFAHFQRAVGPVLISTLGAIAVGIAGAKVWYIVKHRNEELALHRYNGWCIQGFITGATLTALLLLTALHAPVGAALDLTTPGLMFGLAVGRIGCFFAGCCGGPPTAAIWGIWSSDQRVGARRVPTQLMESSVALIFGLVTLAALLARGPDSGAYFAAAVAGYTLVREGILRLRVEQVKIRLPVPVTPIVSALVVVVSLVLLAR